MFLIFCVLMVLATVSGSSRVIAMDEILDAAHDFKFLELQRDLRENPNGPHAREDLFAIGEYYFQENNHNLASEYFRRFSPSKLNQPEDIIVTAYMVRCADFMGDASTSDKLKRELEDMLSSHSYFASFNNDHSWSWKSPLGNRFDFRELVDRMEITLNGHLFYTINLS